jgi:signal transduction histidine kinase
MPIDSTMRADGWPVEDASTPAIDDFVYAVSHDLRSPLLNFQGFLRRLAIACQALHSLAETLPPEQRTNWEQVYQEKVQSSLQVLDENSRRMERLLTALLELSRAGREPLRMQHMDAGAEAQSMIGEFAAAAVNRQASIELEAALAGYGEAGSRLAIWADPDRFRQTLRQLLSNALKFLSPARAGRITIGGAIQSERQVCWVRDNGIGIRARDLDRIFLPFGRIQEVIAPGEGAGLAMARKLTEQQRGRIWAESEHGSGSTFFLAFPSSPGVDQPQPT